MRILKKVFITTLLGIILVTGISGTLNNQNLSGEEQPRPWFYEGDNFFK